MSVLRTLDTQIRRLQVYRSYTATELQKPVTTRDPAIIGMLSDSLSSSIEIVDNIIHSLTFLPSQQAVVVDRYKEMNASYWRLFRNVSDYDLLLTSLNFSDIKPNPDTLEQFSSYEFLIETGWKDLLKFNISENAETSLPTLVKQASSQYYNNHGKLVTQMKAGTQIGFQPYTSPAAWEQSIQDVREKQQAIIDMVQQTTDTIGVRMHRNAARSIFTMVIVLVMSLICSFLLFWLGRRIKQQADTDSLTGLANRSTIESALELANHGENSRVRQAVYLINIRNFQQFNDNYGHPTGDRLLIEVAKRLEQAAPGHLVSRVGGDDYAIHMRNIGKDVNVEYLAREILNSVNGDVEINGTVVRTETTISYAVAPDDSPSGKALLNNAEIAFYRGNKGNQAGGNLRISKFNSSIGDQHSKRRKLEANLIQAIEKQEFTLHYQPKVCTTTCTVRSVEALIRWQDQDSNMISPVEFIPIAEELGLMEKIGTFVMEKACLDIASLHNQGFAGLGVAVNISSQQFMDELFFEKVMNSAQSANLRTGFLELEVTESIVMNDIGRVTDILKKLRETGIKIAVDDFGTGYSCLSYLQDLPLDTLKIDRAFVDKLDKTQPHQTVANSIVRLAVLFGLTTVAEGVENDTQRHEVEQLGIDLIQGYFYSKPVQLQELPQVIRRIENNRPASRQGSGSQIDLLIKDSGEDGDEQDNSFNKAA